MICKVPASGGNVFFEPWRSCGDIFEPRKTREARKVVLSVLSAQPSFPIGKTDFSERNFRQVTFPLATKSIRSRCVKSSRKTPKRKIFRSILIALRKENFRKIPEPSRVPAKLRGRRLNRPAFPPKTPKFRFSLDIRFFFLTSFLVKNKPFLTREQTPTLIAISIIEPNEH